MFAPFTQHPFKEYTQVLFKRMLLSFDVGTKNLAICLLDSDNNIIEWEVESIPRHHSDGICKALQTHLDARDWVTQGVQTVLIERQPPKNRKMKTVEAYLEMYFNVKDIPQVLCYNAVNKVPDCPGKGHKAYIKRKNTAIERAKEYIVNSEQEEKWNTLYDQSQKKDDLADCLLQGLSFKPNQVVCRKSPDDPQKKTCPRKPTENQKRKKYSKSNMCYLVRQLNKGDIHETKKQVSKKKRWMKDILNYYHDLDEAFQDFFNGLNYNK